jgi:endogenous inhibitor of DNA gyrase (YacG/DUF329 family)
MSPKSTPEMIQTECPECRNPFIVTVEVPHVESLVNHRDITCPHCQKSFPLMVGNKPDKD